MMPRYLLVDDSATVRYMLAGALKQAAGPGVEIVEAGTPEAALAEFGSKAPDVVFLDMVMNGKVTGGFVMSKMLEANPRARIVVLTGLPPNDPNVVSVVSDGAFAHLQKPVRAEAIRGVLSELSAEEGHAGRIR
jgi:two-component system nitrogen regulation response regulator NtrX